MSNKTVTFGGVFHFPTLPKNKEDVKKAEAEGKTVSIKNRFNCGSLRNSLKMVGSNGSTLIAIRLVRSKLRKREDNLPTTTATPNANTTTTTTTNHNNNVIQQTNNHNHNHNHLHSTNQAAVVASQQQQPEITTTTVSQTTETPPPPFLWVYHTNGNSTTASSQYTLYNTDQDTLVHNLPCEEPRECKGFRKNLRGKWRRLVKKKQPQEVYTIPAELRDQLKQIYVY